MMRVGGGGTALMFSHLTKFEPLNDVKYLIQSVSLPAAIKDGRSGEKTKQAQQYSFSIYFISSSSSKKHHQSAKVAHNAI